MDAIPTTGQPRPRGKSAAQPKSAQPKSAQPKTAQPKSASKPPSRRETTAQQAGTEVADLGPLIATTAYFLAAARGFEPGRELDDWLEAERRVRSAG